MAMLERRASEVGAEATAVTRLQAQAHSLATGDLAAMLGQRRAALVAEVATAVLR